MILDEEQQRMHVRVSAPQARRHLDQPAQGGRALRGLRRHRRQAEAGPYLQRAPRPTLQREAAQGPGRILSRSEPI